MKKKIFYNMFLTLGIVVSVVLAKKTMDDKNYLLMGICILAIIFFVWKKIDLTKEVRKTFQEQKSIKENKM